MSEGQCYRYNSLGISCIGPTFGSVVHSTMELITFKIAMLGPFLHVARNF